MALDGLTSWLTFYFVIFIYNMNIDTEILRLSNVDNLDLYGMIIKNNSPVIQINGGSACAG